MNKEGKHSGPEYISGLEKIPVWRGQV